MTVRSLRTFYERRNEIIALWAQIEAAIAAMDVAPEYADIRQVESSTAVLYLFSERFMTYGKAYGLCEWFEVEQFQNP
jgi:1,2-phenylacetyl-CoA epoxidase PaaB subunit